LEYLTPVFRRIALLQHKRLCIDARRKAVLIDWMQISILKAVRKHGDLALKSYRNIMASEPDTHAVLAMAGELGLIQQLDPDRLSDNVKRADI
jgi:hypothetical protein